MPRNSQVYENTSMKTHDRPLIESIQPATIATMEVCFILLKFWYKNLMKHFMLKTSFNSGLINTFV